MNTVQGMGASLLFAFIILVLVTGNYIISLYAILSIGIVIITLTGSN